MGEASILIAISTFCITILLIITYLNKEYFMDNLSTIQSIVIPKYYENEIPFYEGTIENFSGKRRNF